MLVRAGYFITTYGKDAVLADFYCVNSITNPTDTGERVQWNLKVCSGKSTIQQANERC
jgi:hypothetical protein